MSLDVIGFGALNVDKLYKVNKIAHPDEESIVNDFSESCGGSAANTIVNLARLGLEAGFVGKLAEDREGELHLKEFEKCGVDVRGIIRTGVGRSGSAIGFVDKEGERALYIDPGVNDKVKIEEIDFDYVEEAEYLHLSSFVGEESFNTQIEIVKKLENSVKVSIDPGIIYARKGLDTLRPIIENTSVFLPSKKELDILIGEDYEKGAKEILKLGPEIVAVKLGGEGCYVTDGEKEFLLEPYEMEVVDTTGAGDAFSAGFLYGLVKGKSLRNSGKIGNLVASRCINQMGSRSDFANLPNLENI